MSSDALTPHMWGQVALEKMKNNSKDFDKVKDQIVSSKRWYKDHLFTNDVIEYDAYKRDIAVVKVFFDTSTALEYTTEPSRTWYDFISAVGGNGGLFIGFSVVTVLEIVWFLFRAILMYLKYTED